MKQCKLNSILSVLLALVMVFSMAPMTAYADGVSPHGESLVDPITEDMIPEGVITIPQACETADDSVVTVIGQVVYRYGKNGSTNTTILEDVIGGEIVGLQIFNACADYKVGDVVKVTGKLNTYGGVKQITAPSEGKIEIELVTSEKKPIAAQEVTISQLREGGEKYLSEYVYIKDIVMGVYSTSNTPVSDNNGKTINIYQAAELPSDVTPADVICVYACYSRYNTTYQLRNGSRDDYVLKPKAGDKVVIYNLSSKGVLALQDENTENPSIENAAAKVVDDKAFLSYGGLVFTVEKNGAYYRFKNETFGYLCSNGTGNNAFYSLTASDDADWKLFSGKKGGFNMESRKAKSNATSSQYLEYYAGAYKTCSMSDVTDYDIYEFMFYPCANVDSDLTGGVCNTNLKYTVTYALGEDGGEGSIEPGTKIHDEKFMLSSETFTRDGYKQVGWWSIENGQYRSYKLGDTYTTNADVTMYPSWNEIITLEVPFTTTVKKGGNVSPGNTTFTLEIVNTRGTRMMFDDDVNILGSVTTNGVGDYKGTLTITGPSLSISKIFASSGFPNFIFVQQVNDGKPNWTYDDTVWAVMLPIVEQDIGENEEENGPPILIFPTIIEKDNDNLEQYVPNADDDYANCVEMMSFTNTYTRSIIILPPPIQTEPEPTEPELTEPEPTEPAEPEETPIPTEPEEPTESIQETVASDDVPKTGDDSNMILWITLLLASGFGATGAVVYSKRKKYVK